MPRYVPDPSAMTLPEHLQTGRTLSAILSYLDDQLAHRRKYNDTALKPLRRTREAVASLRTQLQWELYEKLRPLDRKPGMPDPGKLARSVYDPKARYRLTVERVPLQDARNTIAKGFIPGLDQFPSPGSWIWKDGRLPTLFDLMMHEGADIETEEAVEDLVM